MSEQLWKGNYRKTFSKVVTSLGPTNTNCNRSNVLLRYRYSIQMPYLIINFVISKFWIHLSYLSWDFCLPFPVVFFCLHLLIALIFLLLCHQLPQFFHINTCEYSLNYDLLYLSRTGNFIYTVPSLGRRLLQLLFLNSVNTPSPTSLHCGFG